MWDTVCQQKNFIFLHSMRCAETVQYQRSCCAIAILGILNSWSRCVSSFESSDCLDIAIDEAIFPIAAPVTFTSAFDILGAPCADIGPPGILGSLERTNYQFVNKCRVQPGFFSRNSGRIPACFRYHSVKMGQTSPPRTAFTLAA